MRIMSRRVRCARALVAPILGAVLLLQGLLVPMLDANDGQRPVLESEHAATCIPGHDHTICVQVGANQALSSGEVRLHGTDLALTERLPSAPPAVHAAVPVFVHSPRGPPIA